DLVAKATYRCSVDDLLGTKFEAIPVERIDVEAAEDDRSEIRPGGRVSGKFGNVADPLEQVWTSRSPECGVEQKVARRAHGADDVGVGIGVAPRRAGLGISGVEVIQRRSRFLAGGRVRR